MITRADRHRILLGAAIALAGLAYACTAPRGPRVVSDPDPSAKIPAIKASVAAKDLTAVKQLVRDLDSDDPAVRFYAINGLERLTGQTFGYQYYVDEDKRGPAAARWKAWIAGWEAGQHEAHRK